MLLPLLSVLPEEAEAEWLWAKDDTGVELRGFIRLAGTVTENPDFPLLYSDRSEQSGLALARLIGNGWMGNYAGLELNAYQSYRATTSSLRSPAGLSAPDVERSGSLEWTVTDDKKQRALFTIDRLNVRFSRDRLDLTVGRQAINLATTFYFTPNDFFAPFSAQTFFRVYKPGVDAARLELRLGDLSQLSIIGVAGYEPDSSEPSGWSDSPSAGRSSLLVRGSATAAGFEWALIGGQVIRKNVAGASLQGELFGWLGLRAEGHHAEPQEGSRESYNELTVGAEHRFDTSLELRLEYFYHGSGASSVGDYALPGAGGADAASYLGRHYMAFSAGYEFSPLLTVQFLPMANMTDGSVLFSFNSVYSLSDESEFSLSFSIPVGKKPATGGLRSEFGAYPSYVNLELRSYF